MKKYLPLVILILLGILAFHVQAKFEKSNTTIVVFGEAKITTKPNVATICLGVETESKNVTEALNENSKKLARVISAIEELGISEKNITTTYFSIHPVRDYRTNELKGYRVVNEIKIRTSNLSSIGKIISVAVSSGANRVEWIEFGLSKDKIRSLKEIAIKDACKDAEAKAEMIAKSLNLTIIGISSIREQTTYFQPYRVYSAIPTPTVVPPIKPGEVTISFRIVATFIAR